MKLFLSYIGFCLLVVSACEMPETTDGFSLASYNVQTLFDDKLDGAEFSEYIPSPDGWNSKKYHNRLRQLSRVIRELSEIPPDVLLLQEVEHAGVIRDWERFFIRDLGYKQVVVSNNGSQSIAVLSRQKIFEEEIQGIHWGENVLRPFVEVHLELNTGQRLIIYAVHWKSKREGAEKTEELRRASAHALVKSMRESKEQYPNALILVAGDFNENIDEFLVQDRAYQTALMPISEIENLTCKDEEGGILPILVEQAKMAEHAEQHSCYPVLYHLWEEGEGSYFFDGSWERIDNILFSQEFFSAFNNIRFEVIRPWYLLDSSGRPRRYNPRSANGYSDHLPILITFELE